MKNVRIHILLLLLLLFTGIRGQQNVTFDLTTGTFDKELSYIENIHISGLPIYNGKNVDIIGLEVKGIESEDLKKINSFKGNIETLQGEISTLVSDSLQLAGIDTSSADSLYYLTLSNQLTGEKYGTLSIFASNVAKAKDTSKRADRIASFKTLFKALQRQTNNVLSSKRKEQSAAANDMAALEKKAFINISANPAYWVNPGGASKFQFSLSQKLKMNFSYEFKFHLYSKNTDAFPLERLLNNLTAKFDSLFTAKGGLDTEEIKSNVSTTFNIINTDFYKSAFELNNTNSLVPFSSKISNQTIDSFTKAYREYYNSKENLQSIKTDLSEYLSRIRDSSQNDARWNERSPKTKSDFENLYTIPEEYDMVKFKNIADSLNSASSLIADYKQLPRLRTDVQKHETKVLTSFQRLKLLTDSLKNSYISSGTISAKSTSGATENVELDATRIGTTYGYAILPLGSGSSEFFQFIGLNFRMHDYDFRLKGREAYAHQFLSRLSFMFGMAITDNMQYKGQTLQNLRVGFKPVIGFNFELFKHVNFGAGAIGFMPQPVIDNTGYSEPKWRGYFSVAFDFNIINYLINKNNK